MAMDQGGERLDEAFEDNHDETQDWYFDLPSGAWERQEEKNRQLRANLLGKNTETEPEKDPFTGQPVKGSGFLGRGRKKENKPIEGPKKPVFERRGSDDERVSRFRALREGGLPQGDSWSTEPTPVDENAPLLRNRASAENAPETDAATGESRWDQLFGAPADGGSIVDAMRSWSKKADEEGEGTPGQDADAAGEEEGTWAETGAEADSIVDSLQVWVARRDAVPGNYDENDADDQDSARHREPTGDEFLEATTDEVATQEPAQEFASVVDEADMASTDTAADSLMERIRARALARQEAEQEQPADVDDDPAGAWKGPGAGSFELSKPADEPATPAPVEFEDRDVANARDESGDDGESTLEGLRAWAMSRSRRHVIPESETTENESSAPVVDDAKDDVFESAIGETEAFETVSAEVTLDAEDDESEDEWVPVEPARDQDGEAPSATAEPEEPGRTAEAVSFIAPVEAEDSAAGATRELHTFETGDNEEEQPTTKKPGLLGRLFGRRPKADPAEAAEAAAISAAAWLEEEDTGWGMSRAAATGSNVNDHESDWEPAEIPAVAPSAAEDAMADANTNEVESPVEDAVSNVSLQSETGDSEVDDGPGALDKTVAYLRPSDETDSPVTTWGASDMASNNDSFGWSAPQTEEEAVAEALEEETLVSDSAVDDDDDEPDWSFLKRRHEEATGEAPAEASTWGAADMASNNDSFGWSAVQTEEEAVAEALEEEVLVTDSAVDNDDDEPDWSFLKRRHEEATEATADTPTWGASDMASNNDSFGWSAPQTEEEAVAEALEEEVLVTNSAVDDDDEPDWSFLKRSHEEATDEAPAEAPAWGASDMASNNDSFGWSAPQTEEEAVAEALEEETLVSDSAVDDDDDEPDWSFLKRRHEEATGEAPAEASTWGAADMASNNDSFGWSAAQTEEEAVAKALEEEVLVTDSTVDEDDEPDWSFLKRRHEEATEAPSETPAWGASDMASNNDSFGWSAAQTEEEAVAEALEEEVLVTDSAVDDDDEEPDWSFLKRRHEEATGEAPAEAPAWGASDMASNNDSFGWSAPQTEEEAVAEALEEEVLVTDSAVDDDDDEPDWSFLKRRHEEAADEVPAETPTWGAADMASNNDSFGWSAPQTEEEAVAEALEEEVLVTDSAVDEDDEPDWSFLKRRHEEATGEAPAETPTWGAADMASNNDSFGWSAPQTEEEAVAEALEEEVLVTDSAVDDEDDEPDWSFLKRRHEEATGEAPAEASTWGAADMASNNDSFGWSAAQTEEEAVAEALEDEILAVNSAVDDEPDWSFAPPSEEEPVSNDAATDAPIWGATDNESAEATLTTEATEWEWEPEVDEEAAPVPAFEAPAESPSAAPAEPLEDIEPEWDPEGLDEDPALAEPAAASFAAASLAPTSDGPLTVAPGEPVGMDWDWEAAAEAEANEVPTAEEPTQLGFAMPVEVDEVDEGAGDDLTDTRESDEAAASIESTEPEPVSMAPAGAANDWEAVAAITESSDDALDEFSDEPDLWAAIAEEAALEGEAGEGVADAPHATVFGQYGTRRSDEERNAEYDSQFVVADAEDDAEEDIVLRAFEAHAASDQDEEEEDAPDFDELLGEHADAMEDEDGPAPRGGVAPAGFGAWSPPRTANAFDEESDEWEAAEQPVPAGTAATSLPAEREYANYVGDGSFSAADQAAKRASSRTWVRELVETGLLAILVFLAVRASFQNFKVDGSSMAPTLADGQFLIVNKLVYSEVDVEKMGKYVPFVNAGDDPTRHVFHAPERGDIIVLRDPSNPSVDLIKRVVGMPGDKFEIVDGAIYIDDFLMEEPYIKSEWRDNRPAVIVPEGHYFVMGDNRDNSKDSRSSSIGFIPEDLIIGRAEFSYLPFDRFGRAPNETPILSETEGRPVLTSQRLER